MTRSAVRRRLCGAALMTLVLAPAASAHDIWINKERRTNAAGEWCCNTYDCSAIPEEKIKVTAARLSARERRDDPAPERRSVGRRPVLAVPPPRQHHALLLLP